MALAALSLGAWQFRLDENAKAAAIAADLVATTAAQAAAAKRHTDDLELASIQFVIEHIEKFISGNAGDRDNFINLYSAAMPDDIATEFYLRMAAFADDPEPWANALLDVSELGSLSAIYESNGDPGAVGKSDNGGFAYGSFQIATKTGTMNSFLSLLKSIAPDVHAALAKAGGSVGARQGSTMFIAEWETQTADPQFARFEKAFIKSTHLDPFLRRLQSNGTDLSGRSSVVLNVLWSVSVQHGSHNTVVENALDDRDPDDMSDEELIRAIYAERAKVDKYFSKSSLETKNALKLRFEKELQTALSLL